MYDSVFSLPPPTVDSIMARRKQKKKRLNDDEDWKSLNFTYHQSSPQPFQGVGMSAGSGEMFAGGACKLALFIAEGSSAGLGT